MLKNILARFVGSLLLGTMSTAYYMTSVTGPVVKTAEIDPQIAILHEEEMRRTAEAAFAEARKREREEQLHEWNNSVSSGQDGPMISGGY